MFTKNEAKQLRKLLERQTVNLTDQEALEVVTFVQKWKNKTKYKADERVSILEGDTLLLYKCRQAHTSLATNKPSNNTSSLWTKIDVEHTGTIDDPIPAAPNMEYMCGKYYVENSVIYLMKRDGMVDGETIILDYLPSQLVGHYFIIVKTEGEENEKYETI